MSYFNHKSVAIIFGITCACFFVACSPSLDGAIETPEVPIAEIDASKQYTQSINVNVVDFSDVRGLDNKTASEGSGDLTKPEGDVGVKVQAALSEALSKRGASVYAGAPVKVKGDILSWESKVGAKGMGSIESKASLYIQVQDRDGKEIFSGIYNGNRASQFPVVSRNDVKHSLGMAMSETITQVLEDQRFLQAVSSSNTAGRATW